MSNFTVEEYLQQGQVLMGSGQYVEAVAHLDKALELDERNVDVYISKAIALAYLDRLDEAEKSLQKALVVKKDCADAYFHMGNIAFMQEQYRDCIKYLNLAISNGCESADAYYLLGLVYELLEEPLQALRQYSKAIRADELNAMYRVKKATLEFSMGDYTSTYETAEGLRTYCPDNFEGYHLGAAALTMQGKYSEAKNLLLRAKEVFPEDNDILLDLVRTHLAANEYSEAKKLLENAVENDPTDDELKDIYLNLGKIYIEDENFDEGIEYLCKSLTVGTFGQKDFETQFVLVNVYNSLKQYDKMLDIANQIVEKQGQEPYSLSGRYFVALAKQNLPGEGYKAAYLDAIRFYRQFTLQQPSRVDGYIYRAMCYRELREYEKAVECLDYVLLLSPNSKELHTLKGSMLKEMGKEKEGDEELRLAEQLKSSGLPGFMGGA